MMRGFISDPRSIYSRYSILFAKSNESFSQLWVLRYLNNQLVVVFSHSFQYSVKGLLKPEFYGCLKVNPFFEYSENILDCASDISFVMFVALDFKEPPRVFSLACFIDCTYLALFSLLLIFNNRGQWFYWQIREGISDLDDLAIDIQFCYFSHGVIFENGRKALYFDGKTS